jgi:hypothetical protein
MNLTVSKSRKGVKPFVRGRENLCALLFQLEPLLGAGERTAFGDLCDPLLFAALTKRGFQCR